VIIIVFVELTFKDLKKIVILEATKGQQQKLFERLQNKPFWTWDVEEHKQEDIRANGDCCLTILLACHRKMEMTNHSMTMRK
jgi:hypothetical protein